MLVKYRQYNNNQETDKLINCKQSFGRLVLLGIIICAILVNVIQFYPINKSIPGWNYSVLNSYGTNDLLEISLTYSGARPVFLFSPYLGLAQVLPKANVILPSDCPLITQDLYGLGRAAKVERFNYNAETLFPDFNPAFHELVVYGNDDPRGPSKVAIVKGEDSPSLLIALWRNEMWYLVDAALLTDNGVKEFLN